MLGDTTAAIIVGLAPLILAQSDPPTLTEYGIIGAVVASMLGAIGMMLRWLTTTVSKQADDHKAERTQDRESWQNVVREWKDCHRETCTQTNAALKELSTAIRDNRKP